MEQATAAAPVAFKLLSRKLVKAASSSPASPDHYLLSRWDEWMHHWLSEMCVPVVCFYVHDGSPDFMSSQVLEESLSRSLVPLYPFAGSIKRGSDNELLVECNRGVIFQEALLSSHTLADFASEQPFDYAYELLNPWKKMVDDNTATAITWIQVTRFSCGGVALVASLSHTLCDAAGYFLFMRSWSSLARGEEMPHPVLGKHPAAGRAAAQAAARATQIQPTTVDPEEALELTSTSTFSKVFRFTTAQVEGMKQAASTKAHKATRFEALACHTWRGVTRARDLQREASTRVHIEVDFRSRVDPQLPAEELGNLVLIPSAACKAGEILQQPLSETCRMIHEAVASVDDAAVREFLEKIELGEATPPDFDNGLDFEITSLWRAPLYSFDFGWGKPCSINLAWHSYPSPCALFMPAPPNEAHCVEVLLTGFTREHLTRLEFDPEFMCKLANCET